MKFDTIIIGGGLTGLVCGLWLSRRGKRVCIVSFGQSLLHFFSGSLSGGDPDPAIAELLAAAGQPTIAGGYRLTPLGELMPAALTLTDYFHSPTPELREHTLAIVRLPQYLGLPIEFIVDSLQAKGKTVQVIGPDAIATAQADVVLVPATAQGVAIRAAHGDRVRLMAAMPPSIPGHALHDRLQQTFQQMGGTYLSGDRVVRSVMAGGRIAHVETERLGDECLRADNYLLATGSFQSEGLLSHYSGISEPIFGLDVNAPADRTLWTAADFFGDQPYQHYGVLRSPEGHGLKDGHPVTNLYPVGHILGGARSAIENLNDALAVCRKLV